MFGARLVESGMSRSASSTREGRNVMARVFITGSSDGLGRGAAQLLVEQGHSVVLHGRNEQRAQQAMTAVPGAETAVMGDGASIAQACGVAGEVRKLGSRDAGVHKAR